MDDGRIIGMDKLNKRLAAISKGRPLLQKLQIDTTANAKRMVPRKTGNLGRTIHPGGLSDRDAFVWASAKYAAYVEEGTKPHLIRPRNARALRFPSPGSATTLGGRLSGGSYIFAKVVHHPGTRPQPFLFPGAKKAVKDNGVDIIVDLWNAAA